MNEGATLRKHELYDQEHALFKYSVTISSSCWSLEIVALTTVKTFY